MPKAGTYTALQKLRPITTNFGEIVEGAVFKEERRTALKKAEEEARKKEKSKIASQFEMDYDSLFDVVTKTKSIDEAYTRGINSARDVMGVIYKDIERRPSLANDVVTQIKLQNLKNYSKNLKLISDRYAEYASTVGKGMQDGSLSQWNKDTLSDLDSIFRQANLDVRVDPETGLPIAVIAELDENGVATGRLKELNLIEVLDGRGLTDTVETFDFQKSIEDIGTKLGKREVKTSSGLSHIEYQRFEDIEPDVRTMVSGFIGNEINPSPIAKSIWSDRMGEDPKDLTKEDMKRIEDFYVASIKGFYDEKNKQTVAFGAIEARRKGRREEEKETGLGLQLRTDEQGRPLTGGLTGVSGDIGGAAFSFTLPKDIVFGVKGQKKLIDNLFLTGAGKMAYEGTSFIGKKTGELIDPKDFLSGKVSGEQVTKQFVGGGLSTSELNNIARDLGYRNAAELKKELEAARDSGLGKKDATTVDTSKYN